MRAIIYTVFTLMSFSALATQAHHLSSVKMLFTKNISMISCIHLKRMTDNSLITSLTNSMDVIYV